jgi:hypothetical protein
VYRVVSGPATVSGSTVTLNGTGTVTIEASQPGNEFFNAASFNPQRSFTVTASSANTITSREELRASDNETFAAGANLQLSIYPNPLHRQGTIRLAVPEATAGYVGVYDGGGRLVKQLGFYRFESGRITIISLYVAELSKGTYFLRFSNNKKVVSRAFQVM